MNDSTKIKSKNQKNEEKINNQQLEDSSLVSKTTAATNTQEIYITEKEKINEIWTK